jgi:hypothetical protein
MSDIISGLGLDEDNIKWYQFAACNNMDTNWFYDIYETDIHIAKQADKVCLHCPVAKNCFNEGVSGREFGVWGGVYLNLGRIDKSSNSHKTEEVWNELEGLHGERLLR